MRKTLSAVLAAAALFGGAAISNGAANAEGQIVYKPFNYDVISCEGKGNYNENNVWFQTCKVEFKDTHEQAEYAFVDGFSNVHDVTVPASLGGHDVLQIGWGQSIVEGLDQLKAVTIKANRSRTAGIDSVNYMTISNNAFKGRHLDYFDISGMVYFYGDKISDIVDASEINNANQKPVVIEQ